MKLMRSFFLLIFVVLLFSNSIFAQAYNMPESAVYDAVNDRYLISNLSGDIISVPRANTNNLSFYKQGAVKSVRGMAIDGATLYAAATANDDTQVLLAIILATGVIQKSITITEGSFVNDVTVDATGNVYLSDNNNIYKFDPTTGTYLILLANAGANGLLFDAANNRLLYTDDTPQTGSQISAIDINTNTTSVLIVNPGFSGLDGLTVDHLGNYYVSCWSLPNAVYRYDPNFTSSTLISTGFNNVPHNGAADIYFDQANKILVVPNMNANTVDFIPFNRLPTLTTDDISVIPLEFQLHQNFPNPFNPTTTIFYDINVESLVSITVFDLLGGEVVKLVNNIEQPGTKSIVWDGRNSEGNMVNAGTYIYKIDVGTFSQTKKMVLLK